MRLSASKIYIIPQVTRKTNICILFVEDISFFLITLPPCRLSSKHLTVSQLGFQI